MDFGRTLRSSALPKEPRSLGLYYGLWDETLRSWPWIFPHSYSEVKWLKSTRLLVTQEHSLDLLNFGWRFKPLEEAYRGLWKCQWTPPWERPGSLCIDSLYSNINQDRLLASLMWDSFTRKPQRSWEDQEILGLQGSSSSKTLCEGHFAELWMQNQEMVSTPTCEDTLSFSILIWTENV